MPRVRWRWLSTAYSEALRVSWTKLNCYFGRSCRLLMHINPLIYGGVNMVRIMCHCREDYNKRDVATSWQSCGQAGACWRCVRLSWYYGDRHPRFNLKYHEMASQNQGRSHGFHSGDTPPFTFPFPIAFFSSPPPLFRPLPFPPLLPFHLSFPLPFPWSSYGVWGAL